MMIPTPDEKICRNGDGSIHAPVHVGNHSGTAWVDLKPSDPEYAAYDKWLRADGASAGALTPTSRRATLKDRLTRAMKGKDNG